MIFTYHSSHDTYFRKSFCAVSRVFGHRSVIMSGPGGVFCVFCPNDREFMYILDTSRFLIAMAADSSFNQVITYYMKDLSNN